MHSKQTYIHIDCLKDQSETLWLASDMTSEERKTHVKNINVDTMRGKTIEFAPVLLVEWTPVILLHQCLVLLLHGDDSGSLLCTRGRSHMKSQIAIICTRMLVYE